MSEQNKTHNSELVNELNKLGENLGNLLKSAWESDERRSIEREVTAGLEQMSKKLNEAAEKIRNDSYVNNAKQAAKDAWTTANVPSVLDEMRKGVISTLQRINEDLATRSTPAHEASARKATEAAAETVVDGSSKPE
jgi:ElaB/YqjD/DUF883 family membrane-anchored ribosome-binding protein